MATKKASKSTKKSAAKKSAAKKSAAKKSAAKKSSKGAASKTATKKIIALPPSPGKCSGWKAVSNRQPPGPATLRVTGKCTFPRLGYKVKLVKAVPQGINPAILLLRKVVTPPSGPSPTIPQTIPVVYVQKGGTNYTHVTILPEVVTVKIQIVV